jgi:mannitol/fructose-specific phosphotransferase system IIA component (Ntr-type)
VEIIIAQIALSMGLIRPEVFSVLVLMAVFTTLTVPVLLKIGVEWLRGRDELARSGEARRGAIIVGAHPLGRAIGRAIADRGEPVFLIDTNRGRCAAAEREGLASIHGSAASEETLAVAGAKGAQALLAMTSNPAVNNMVSEIARDLFRVPDLYRIHGLRQGDDSSSSSSDTANPVGSRPLFPPHVDLVEWNRILARDEYDRKTVEFADAAEIEAFSREEDARNSILPLLIERRGLYIPAGAEPFRPGDTLHYLRQRADTDPYRARLLSILRDCPVLDLKGPLSLGSFLDRATEAMAWRLNLPAAGLHSLLEEREKESSTVIAPGLAIPHVILEGTGRFDILVARCREGVQFPEAGKVRTLFVLLSSRDERTMYLRSLSTIARLVGGRRFERHWMDAADTEELRAILLYPDPEFATSSDAAPSAESG